MKSSKTKIVVTLGPKTCNADSLKAMLSSGLDIIRLNGSHNTLDWHKNAISLVRQVSPLTPILLDIPGRKVRTTILKTPKKLEIGETLTFTTDSEYRGDDKIKVTYPDFHQDLETGNTILADDGTLKFTIIDVSNRDITCRIETKGYLKSSKGLNIPYVKMRGPVVSEKDRHILEFCVQNDVDFVGISFVESAKHIAEVRTHLSGSNVEVISKIENKFGIDNLDEIVSHSDAILIDRGDLAAETEIEKTALFQKRIIRSCNLHSKPVIVATEMLHTMIENPQPTKAEIIDITNAVIDGASATMLSGETAVGEYPEQAITIMNKVALCVEEEWRDFGSVNFVSAEKSVPNSIGRSVYEICREMPVTKVICITKTGFAPKMISRYRLDQPILAVTPDENVARKLNLSWGVVPVKVDVNFSQDSSEHIPQCLETLYCRDYLNRDDLIVVTSVKYPKHGNYMNSVEVYYLKDLVESLSWKKE